MPIWLCIILGIVGSAFAFGPILGFANDSIGTTYIGDWDEESIERDWQEGQAPLPIRIIVWAIFLGLMGGVCTLLVIYVPH